MQRRYFEQALTVIRRHPGRIAAHTDGDSIRHRDELQQLANGHRT